MYRVRDILIFNKKSSLKMKISCGQWIMRLTLIVMYALCSIGQERVCYIKVFLCRYIFFGFEQNSYSLDEYKYDIPVKMVSGSVRILKYEVGFLKNHTVWIIKTMYLKGEVKFIYILDM